MDTASSVVSYFHLSGDPSVSIAAAYRDANSYERLARIRDDVVTSRLDVLDSASANYNAKTPQR